jgi:AcrR family transcriptional regulator
MSRPTPRRVEAVQDGWERRRNILLSEYERVALELFAERGYNEVTVDDIAAAAGVTTRTLFRYFGSKQDCILGFPRRGLAAEVEMIDALDTSADPFRTAWAGLVEFVTTSPVDPQVVELWEAATAGAPEVVARVRGERIDAIFRAFTTFGERCYGVEQHDDPRPRSFAGIMVGIEFALVESVPQAPGLVEELIEAAAATIEKVAGPRLRATSVRASLSPTD